MLIARIGPYLISSVYMIHFIVIRSRYSRYRNNLYYGITKGLLYRLRLCPFVGRLLPSLWGALVIGTAVYGGEK